MADQQRFPLPRLTNQNYQIWKFRMEMLLVREELWDVISKPKPEPVTDQWTKADHKARATIGLCIDDSQTSLVRDCASAKDAWKALKDYHDKGSEVYLLKKLTHLELREDGDMEQHLQHFTDLVQRIASTGEALPAKLQVAMLLCSLPDSYDALTTALEQRPSADLTLELVKSKLLAEAEKRRERSGADSADGASGGKALKVDYRHQRSDGGASGSKETRPCFHCGKPGHLKKNCWSRKKESGSNEEASKRKEETDQRKEESAKAKQAQDVADRAIAWIAGTTEAGSWFVDSGASKHMTGSRKFFDTLKETRGVSVMLADGSKAAVEGVGSGKIVGVDGDGNPREIVLSDVLFVPKLASGLISVSTLTNKCFSVMFVESGCEVRNKNGEVAAVADRYGSLYRLRAPDRAMRVVGSVALVQPAARKMEAKAFKIVYSYSKQHKAYRFHEKEITSSRDTPFLEELKPKRKTPKVEVNRDVDEEEKFDDSVVWLDPLPKMKNLADVEEEKETDDDTDDTDDDRNSSDTEDDRDSDDDRDTGDEAESAGETEAEEKADEASTKAREASRRSTRGKLPVRFNDYVMEAVKAVAKSFGIGGDADTASGGDDTEIIDRVADILTKSLEKAEFGNVTAAVDLVPTPGHDEGGDSQG